MIIFHNPRCSKSREAIQLLENKNLQFEIKEYLKNPPSIKELKDLVKALNCKPIDIVRKKESLFIEKYATKKFTEAQWFKILSENPILIERPILINKQKAVIGRPPELIIEFLKKAK